MIVVGILVPGAPSGIVVEIARRAASRARTEVVGVARAGLVGDQQLLQLASAGIGHATITRSAATGVEPADLELALRYLPDVRVIALVEPTAPLIAVALAASAWSGAALVLVGPLHAEAVAILDTAAASAASSDDASTPMVLEPPASDPDGAFAGVVAALAARLDAGEALGSAWQSTIKALAIDSA
jgi:hypothetical protein